MNRVAWAKSFTKFFVPDKAMEKKALKKKVPQKKIKIVGDLMIDAVLCETSPKDPDKTVVALMPGSRPAHIRFLAPFFLKAADLIREKDKSIEFILGLSPYTSALKLEEYISRGRMKKEELKEGAAGRLVMRDGKKYVIYEKGTEVLLVEKNPYQAMASAELIITIPGTNTAEAAAMGRPMLVAVPFNKPEAYIFDGLIGIIGNAPLIGRHIKRAAIKILNRAMKFTALPNRKAGEMVVPELRGDLKAADIASKALEMLSDPQKLAETGLLLKRAMGAPGAADRIAEEIAELT
jgi:lipid A disaccharide synthetase